LGGRGGYWHRVEYNQAFVLGIVEVSIAGRNSFREHDACPSGKSGGPEAVGQGIHDAAVVAIVGSGC